MDATSMRSRRRTPGAKAAPASAAATATVADLDRKDIAILKLLQKDAWISNVELARRIHLSAPACLRRVERLKRTGIIRRAVTLLDPKAAGSGMLMMIGVVLERLTPTTFPAFEKAAAKIPGCMECHMVTGDFDYFLILRIADVGTFAERHTRDLLFLPGVRQIRSFMVTREVLSTTELPLQGMAGAA